MLFRSMYLPADLCGDYLAEGLAKGLEMYLALPHITRGCAPDGFWERAGRWLDKGLQGFLVRNLETFAMLKELGLAEKCVLDHSLYTWNGEAQAFWREQGILRDRVPLELNAGELSHRDNRHSEMLIYGYLPLMHSAQCVRRNLYGCLRGETSGRKALLSSPRKAADGTKEPLVYLRDRYEKVFPVECFCNPWKTGTTGKTDFCYNIIYNTLPFGLLEEKKQVQALRPAALRLVFTREKPAEAAAILRDCVSAYREGRDIPHREFTKGHFKRGAE